MIWIPGPFTHAHLYKHSHTFTLTGMEPVTNGEFRLVDRYTARLLLLGAISEQMTSGYKLFTLFGILLPLPF